MLIAAIILGSLALLCLVLSVVYWFKDEYGESKLLWFLGFLLIGFVWLIVFLISLNYNWGTSVLTGNIYSSEDRMGYTVGHIRLSDQAGSDTQPSFCAKSDSAVAKQITELAGSGKKVKVTIPPYFYFSNNPFACGTTDTKIEVQ